MLSKTWSLIIHLRRKSNYKIKLNSSVGVCDQFLDVESSTSCSSAYLSHFSMVNCIHPGNQCVSIVLHHLPPSSSMVEQTHRGFSCLFVFSRHLLTSLKEIIQTFLFNACDTLHTFLRNLAIVPVSRNEMYVLALHISTVLFRFSMQISGLPPPPAFHGGLYIFYSFSTKDLYWDWTSLRRIFLEFIFWVAFSRWPLLFKTSYLSFY